MSAERLANNVRAGQPITITNRLGVSLGVGFLSPDFAADYTVYALSQAGLFRSSDGGATWERWADERLSGRDYKNALTVGAASPLLKDGSYRLFVGTAAGEFWTLDPRALRWEAVPGEVK